LIICPGPAVGAGFACLIKVMLGFSANSGPIFAENSVMTLEPGAVHVHGREFAVHT
jgi:hypothetical protein